MVEGAKPLRAHRVERLHTIRSLGRAAGLSPMTIFNVEHRRFRPSNATMRKIADALQVEIGEVEEFEVARQCRTETYRAAAA